MIRLWLFSLTIAVYGLFSSSTPDEIGWPEVFIGIMLVFLFGQEYLNRFIYPGRYSLVEFFWFLSVLFGTLLGIWFWPLSEVIRDLIPHIYLLLPFVIPKDWVRSRLLIFSVVFAAISFSFRHILTAGASLSMIGSVMIQEGLDYFPLDPIVFTTALLLLWLSTRESDLKNRVILASCSLLPMIGVAAILLRGPLIFYSFYVLYSFVAIKGRSGGFKWIAITVLAVLAINLLPLEAVFDLVRRKFEKNGINGREMESLAALSYWSSSIRTLIFGSGLGGSFSNPVIGDKLVSFTHNSFTYYSFKLGFFGQLFIMAIYSRLALRFYRDKISTKIFIMFVAGIFLVLEASFKSFGMSLAMFLILNIYRRDEDIGYNFDKE